MKLLDFTPNSLTLEVHCSKGTYIRVLGEDIAQALGSGGYLASLRRIRSGDITLEGLVTLPQLLDGFEQEGEAAVLRHLLPADYLIRHLPEQQLNQADAERMLHGQPVKWLDSRIGISENTRLYAPDHQFIGLGQVREEAGQWLLHPVKMLNTADPD